MVIYLNDFVSHVFKYPGVGFFLDDSECNFQRVASGGNGAGVRHAHPSAIDDLAADFPNLKIIMAHPGWSWVEETTAVALQKGNVFWEMLGWAPKHFPGNLMVDIRGWPQDKVMFGFGQGIAGAPERV